MEKNQELKLVHNVSRSANVSDNDESVNDKNNNDKNPNNNKDENEDNNELEDKENQKRIEIYNDETTESIAFKSQFDEIIYSKKLLENAKPNNYNNNNYYNPHARASSLSSLNGRKVSETENLYFTHQKSYSHSNQYQQQSSKYNHNQAKHKRNNSSIPKLNLSGINNNNSYYPAINRNFMNTLSSTPYIGYDIFDELSFDDAFDLKYSLKELDHSNAKFNNNKYNRYDSDWDLMSSNQGYHTSLLPPPLTPSSIHSSTPSSYSPSLSPYYTPTSAKSSYHHHLFLDDKEFLAQQLLLEEERKLLEMQQIQLNDAIVALRSETENNNDSNNFDPVFKSNLVQTPVTLSVPPTLNSNSNSNSKFKSNASLSHKTSPSQLLNHFSSTLSPPSSSSQSKNCHQEPIGTPFRKHSPSNFNKNNNPNMPNIMPISMSTASSSSTSLSLSSPSSSPTYRHNPNSTFSLFSKLPSLSMNASNSNISNTSGDPNASNANSTNNNAAADVILTPPSMPITPPITPRDNNNSISYFNPISSLNILNLGNPRPKNNPSNKYHNGPFYNNLRTATTFDEREEDLSLWYSEPFGKKFERPLRFENGNKNNNNISLKHHRHHSRSSGLIV